MNLVTWLVCKAIGTYKRWISPRKGFSCAHRVLHERESCSTAVMEIVRNRGLLSGWSAIICRFKECNEASRILDNRQRADLDCGLGCLDVGGPEGCFGDFFGKGSGAASAGTRGCGCLGAFDIFAFFTGRQGKRNFAVVAVLALLALVAGYFTYGNRISAIEIRLLSGQEEDQDRKWGLVADSELPDYQLLLLANNVKVQSSTAHNQSANQWLKIDLNAGFRAKEITRIEITNKQLLTNKSLEVFDDVKTRQTGEQFEYRLVRRWNIF